MAYRLGIDIGGTFTDFALLKDDGVVLDKTLSTPRDHSLAVMDGLAKLAECEGRTLGDFLAEVEAIVHGTTVADNTLIQMNGAVTGLLTTEGFRDELELRRGFKEDIWDVRLSAPDFVVPRRRRLTVPERILSDGSIFKALDEAAARKAIRRLKLQNVESVAISLLFSFANSIHERRLAELVREEMPDVAISLSSEVLPRAPEFDRTSTTVVNAYLGPSVSHYLDRLEDRLKEAGYGRQLLVMQSSGGVMTREYLRGSPIRVLASGPAGGVVGAACVAEAKHSPDLLCVDMGGTSYDVSVVIGASAPAEVGWNWHHRNLIGVPMVGVETLGAGGGSICVVKNGTLEVGPESAGADPGPICYGRGGTRPTVTDAILMLGILEAGSEFAGGRFELTRDGVAEAFQEQIAAPLNCSVEAAAFNSLRVVNANMTQAVRRMTAGKGIDPKSLTLLAYGGNGPAFAAIQAEELGIRRVLVPRSSPTFSALGALAAKPTIDEERAYLVSATAADPGKLSDLWRELDERAEAYFIAAGFKRDDMTVLYQINLRYPGQNFALVVDVEEIEGARDLSFVSDELFEEVVEGFHREHEASYGHRREEEVPEIAGVRLQASAEITRPIFGEGFTAKQEAALPGGTRKANLGRGLVETGIYRGADLKPGHTICGPGIIEESFTTIVVYPGWTAMIDDAGDYVLDQKG
ncbi:MAG: hydantoinase/oxoprolinase family protein [Myxococcota bacterium]|nr:methylhydantoinase [Deltaproteobacteria bacterium]MCP4242764.1 hydantoinase/oxoprolinase family protein [bacterium]MDP7075286.1 hydantoinase/oxoprolinase family protein [Myxococcota bacterium]MDP7299160.1 hydantoinase/oxoprolinase family protein [Myxococcota bacterium]MDP7434340.1 hydantoinase/oxoprolinase family protein [Myxococcota bacterium]